MKNLMPDLTNPLGVSENQMKVMGNENPPQDICPEVETTVNFEEEDETP